MALVVTAAQCLCVPSPSISPPLPYPLELYELEPVRNTVGEGCHPRMSVFSPHGGDRSYSHYEPVWYRERRSGGRMPGNSTVVSSC